MIDSLFTKSNGKKEPKQQDSQGYYWWGVVWGIQSLAMHKDRIYLITKEILWLFKLIIVTIWDIELIN